MNEKFLDKFFKLYSVLSKLFAKHAKLEQFLISSYYLNAPLLYPYEYIDFCLYYCKGIGVIKTDPDYTEVSTFITLLFSDIDDLEISSFLFQTYDKIIDDINRITESDVVCLNEYYKKLIGT